MTSDLYKDAYVLLDGKPAGVVADVSYERVVDEAHGWIPGWSSGPCEIHLETTIKGRLFDEWARLLSPRGASNGTLAKRVGYGGRKGRSALRRLHQRGFVGVMIVDGHPCPMPPVTIRGMLGSGAHMLAQIDLDVRKRVRAMMVETALGEELDQIAGLMGAPSRGVER